MLNILVTGANGQLGSEIRELSINYPYRFFFTNKTQLDISDEKAIEKFIVTHNINTILNCAAYTAVDKAESERENAYAINAYAVKTLASLSKQYAIKFIHISTDYVFNGTHFQPYLENHATDPLSVYGESKRAGEEALLEVNPTNTIIIRTSWVYSSYGNNFVKTMLRLAKEKESLNVIYDQIGTPTYAKDLAYSILEILPKISNQTVEIYHYSNEGVASWYDFAKEITFLENLTCRIEPITTEYYPLPAKRPYYSLLNKSKIKQTFDIKIPHWKESLKVCLSKMNNTKG
jgi:dTDP-4-dehydrorhamnose reductase